MVHWGQTYLSALGDACPATIPRLLVGSDRKLRPWNEVNPERAAAGVILPGDFIDNCFPEPLIIRAVLDDNTPYSWLAFDCGSKRRLDEWAWLDPSKLQRIGNPRLDRIADLARFVSGRLGQLQADPDSPLSGKLKPGQEAANGVFVVTMGNGEEWAYRVPDPSLSKNPEKISLVLSWYGQLKILGLLLQEKARALLDLKGYAHCPSSLSQIVMAHGHPMYWPAARLADLEALPGELLRCAASYIPKASTGQHQPSEPNVSAPKSATEHPALTLLHALNTLHTVCSSADRFRKLAESRERIRAMDLNGKNVLAKIASDRANELARTGASREQQWAAIAEGIDAANNLPPFNESAERADSLRETVLEPGLTWCKRARAALRDGGAKGLDAATHPNAAGQTRSIELHTKLQDAERVFNGLTIGVGDPRIGIDKDSASMTDLGEWFARTRDELGAVIETRGLETFGNRELDDRVPHSFVPNRDRLCWYGPDGGAKRLADKLFAWENEVKPSIRGTFEHLEELFDLTLDALELIRLAYRNEPNKALEVIEPLWSLLNETWRYEISNSLVSVGRDSTAWVRFLVDPRVETLAGATAICEDACYYCKQRARDTSGNTVLRPIPAIRESGQDEYRPATWFPKGMADRLRQAASKARKTKRVDKRTVDGVVCYSVADARRWWSSDFPTDA